MFSVLGHYKKLRKKTWGGNRHKLFQLVRKEQIYNRKRTEGTVL